MCGPILQDNIDLLAGKDTPPPSRMKTIFYTYAIVKDIVIQQSPRMTKEGKSIEAIVAVHFQTFEIITKESLDEIYTQNVTPLSAYTIETVGMAGENTGNLA